MVKKQLKELIESLQAAGEVPPGQILFGDGGDMGMQLLTALPYALVSQLKLMVDTFDHLAGLSEEKRKEVLDAWKEALSELPLGELVNAYFRLSRLLWETEAEGMAAAELELARRTISTVDFGKVRKAVEVKLQGRYPVWEGVLGALVEDPIIVANLITTLPPLLNNLIRLLSSSVSRLDLPSEILASAVFNVLEDLDVEEVARLASGLAGVINSLHEGNLILGRSEPRFREVASRIIERYLEAVDWRANNAALVALAEDLEVLIGAFTDALSSRPEVMADGVGCAARMVASLIRAASHFSLKLTEMPNDFYQAWARALLELSEPREAGVLLNSLVRAHNRLLEAETELGAKLLEEVLGSVDTEELGKAVRSAARQVFTLLARRPDLADWLQPQEAGRILDGLIKAYNRSSWSAGGVRDYASAKLAQVESAELEKALRSAGGQVVEALAERPEILLALFRAGAGAGWKLFKGLLRSLAAKARSRKGG